MSTGFAKVCANHRVVKKTAFQVSKKEEKEKKAIRGTEIPLGQEHLFLG